MVSRDMGPRSGGDAVLSAPPPRIRPLPAFAVALQAYVIVGGLVSLLGWALDRPRLSDWDNDGISIQPNATVAAMAAGVAVCLLLRGQHRAVAMLGAFVALLGASTILQYVSGLSLGIDTC